jgi:hypothetical protein
MSISNDHVVDQKGLRYQVAEVQYDDGGSTPVYKVVGVTQAEYNAIDPKDANTLYVITDA